MSELVENLDDIARGIYEDLTRARIPKVNLSTRTKSNIVFDEDTRVWKYGDQLSTRSAKTSDGAYMLLRTI